MFREEILEAKQDLQTEAEIHPNLTPYYAGRAHMIRMKKNRLRMLRAVSEIDIF